MFVLELIKSIIVIHSHYQTMNYSNNDFLVMIDKCFNIKKTTFYDWLNNDDIINADTIYENQNNNKLINYAVEKFIINLYNNNKNVGIKNIKKQVKNNFKFSINNKSIHYIFYKNNIKHKNIKKIDFYKDNFINKKIIQNLLK